MASRRRHDLLEIGNRAPDFRLPKLEGGEVALSELVQNGPVILAFFKITCPVCQMTFPFLERIHTGASKIPIYGISQNDQPDTRDFARQFKITFPLLLDGEDAGFPASNAYGISSVPTIFVVEPGCSISQVIEGWSRRDIGALGERAGFNPIRPTDRVPELKGG